MIEQVTKYRQIAVLADGTRALLRPLMPEDRDRLVALFETVSDQDLRLMHHNVRDRELVAGWAEQLDYHKVLPLVAVVGERLAGDATLRFFHGPQRHIGGVRVFIAPEFRRRGLGTAMLRALIELARKCGVQQLEAEVLASQVKTVNAFKQLGFELRTTFPDFFMTPDGETHDVNVLFMRLVRKQEEF